MDTVKSQIAQILKKRRKEANLRAKDVLDALKNRGIVISDKTLYGWENGYRQPDADTFLVLCEIYGIDSFTEITSQIPEVESENPHFSHEAQQVALAYDRSDKRTQKIVWTALEDFMETPVPTMAQRRTERTAADDEPNSRRVLDERWREWRKKNPGTGEEVTPANGFSAIVVVDPYKMGAENDAKSAEPLRRYQFEPYSEKSDNGKTEHSSCAQCPLAGRCSQRFSEKPFLGLRFGLQVVDGDGKKEPPVLLSDEECPLYNLLKSTAPKSSSGERILLDENGKSLLSAGNIDLSAILGMISPVFQRELSKAMNPSGDNGDDSEKA